MRPIRMPRKQMAAIAVASLAALTACPSSGGSAQGNGTMVRADAARAAAMVADASEIAERHGYAGLVKLADQLR